MDQFGDVVNLQSSRMILAGDIGGTKTLIGLFAPGDRRPTPAAVRSFPTTAYDGLPDIIDAFFAEETRRPAVSAAAFGVAGPVINQSAQMTNIVWRVEAAEVAERFAMAHVKLLNDLEAMAYAVPVLAEDELHTLQAGQRQAEGNIAVIAAGTGLGGALLPRIEDHYVPVASEFGHTDFAARTDRDLEFVRFLRSRYGRAEVEHVLCGPGILNLAQFTHREIPCRVVNLDSPNDDMPAEISASAINQRCPRCVEALDMFVDAYGAAAGDLGLTVVATGGVFIGGGIAPRILQALDTGRLIAAFVDKGPMQPLLESMPVHVILNERAALLGAAVFANQDSEVSVPRST
jgi:glucokinase